MKLVRAGSRPISGDTGLHEIQRLAEANLFTDAKSKGILTKQNILPALVEHLHSYINLDKLHPLKLVVNAGNGAAGHVIDALEQVLQQRKIPVSFIKIYHAPDGSFPN